MLSKITQLKITAILGIKGKTTSTSRAVTTGDLTFEDSYVLGKKLGEGAFSVVKEARHKATDLTYAAKITTKSKLSKDDLIAIKDEVVILKDLRHQNIVRLYDSFEDPRYYYAVLETMKGGELFDRIVAKTSYNEKEARDVCKIVFDALDYCHTRKIAHRDLKPDNLLLISKTNDHDIKIADFGMAKSCSSEECLTTCCGTPNYVAPEIILDKPYGTKVDMWSMGVIVYILLGGYPPFNDENQKKLFRKIKKGSYEFPVESWGAVSQDAKNMIAALLTVDPKERLSAKEALKSEWITGCDEKLLAADLGNNIAELKKFNAKNKLRHAVFSLIATNKMTSLGAQFRTNNADTE